MVFLTAGCKSFYGWFFTLKNSLRICSFSPVRNTITKNLIYAQYTLLLHLRMKALAKSHGHKWLKAYNRAKYKTKPKYEQRKCIRITLCFSSPYLDWETFT